MLRRPHYCCNCGELVERTNWRWWNSRRFCELCETEFVFEEWWPRVVQLLILSIGFSFVGLGMFEEKPEPPRITRELVYREPLQKGSTPAKEKKKAPKGDLEERKSSLQESVRSAPVERESVPVEPVAVEEVSYCGAITKKGTPCSRRVKKGVRCWQHKEIEISENP